MPPLQVVEQPQPYGEQGVRFSLDEVARRVAKGGLDAKVRAWSIERLEMARRELGTRMDTERQRAETLLKAVQKKLWVPDPVGAEFMVGAHLMACDRSTPEAICFHGEDCDGVTSLLGACLLSVGIYVAVVGHAYNGSSSIGHVLCAAWVDGQWEYADPSTDLALGKCVRFSRERLISVPNVKVICDANVCLRERTDYHPEKNDFVVKGVFVGVDGPAVRPPVFFWNANPQVIGLGVTAEQAAQTAAEQAAAKKINEGGGITNQDAADVAGVAAGAAAAVLCAEGGPVASAACGTVAAAVTEFLTKALLDGLADLGNAGVIPSGVLPSRGFFIAQIHNRLFPKEKAWTHNDGVDFLIQSSQGSAVQLSKQGVQVKNFSGNYQPVEAWPPINLGPGAEYNRFYDYTKPAFNKGSAALVGRAAVEQSTKQTMQVRTIKKSSSSPLVPVLVIGVAAGGLYWWMR